MVILAAALATVLLLPSPVAAQVPPEDGCDAAEPVACLPLPESEEDDGAVVRAA